MKRKPEICVYMHDARLFYQITRKFRMENIPFIALDDLSRFHRSWHLLITTSEDIRNVSPILRSSIKILEVNPKENPEQVLLKTFLFLKNMQNFRKMTIGIDPGRRMTGIAIFFDGVFAYSREISNLDELCRYIQTAFQTFPLKKKIIKIGDGVISLTERYVQRLFQGGNIASQSEIQIVNETNTTKRPYRGNHKLTSKHEKAAMFIGRRRGQKITHFEEK